MNKEQILKRVASVANGEAVAPTGDELNQWSEFLESSQNEWAGAYDPQVLIKVHVGVIQQSGTSMALPSQFKEKFAGFVKVGGNLLDEFDPVEATFASGDYVTWGGNQSDGYYLNVSKAQLSAVSVAVPYHSRPTSLSTLTSISPIPDPEFLVARTTEYVLMQRGQPEYVEFQSKADVLLQRMVGNEVSAEIQKNNTIRTTLELNNFTLGED